MYGYGYSAYNRLAFLSPPLDIDAKAFLTATGITGSTITTAINNLVIDLKSIDLWDKMKAIYPFVGGTATTHKFNLKDPRDLDVAFRLSFNGGLFHTSNGIQGNGVNGYFDTFLNPSSVFDSASGGSMFTYIRNNFSTGVDLGAFQSVVNYRIQLSSRGAGNVAQVGGLSNNTIQEASTNSMGFWGVTRLPSSSSYYLIKNSNSTLGTDTYREPNSKLFGFVLGFDSTPYPLTYSNHEFAFTCVANGLTLTESSNLYLAVQKFQTTLGRQV